MSEHESYHGIRMTQLLKEVRAHNKTMDGIFVVLSCIMATGWIIMVCMILG